MRHIKVIIWLVLLTFSCVVAVADGAVNSLTLPEGVGVSHFCSDRQGGFYLTADNNTLYHWNDHLYAEPTVTASPQDMSVAGLACADDVLYAMTDKHTAVCLQDGAWMKLGTNPDTDSVLFNCHLAVAEDRLFYSFKIDSDEVGVYELNMSTREWRRLPGFETMQIFADVDQHTLFSVQYDSNVEGQVIASYNYLTGETGSIALTGYDGSFLNQYFEANSKTFFLTTREAVYTCGLDGQLSCYRDEKGFSRIIPLSDGRMAQVDINAVYVYPSTATTQVDLPELTVLGFSSVHNSAFTAQTGIKLEQREQLRPSMWDEISQILLTQDNTVDLIALWAQDGLSLLQNKGYYTDLSSSKTLVDASMELYPALRNAIMLDNGQLTAWPVWAAPSLMTVETALLEEYGFDAPQTMDELLDLIPRIWESDMLQENGYRMFDTLRCCRGDLFRYEVEQYIRTKQLTHKKWSFNSEEFQHTAQRILDELPDDDPMAASMDGTESPLFALTSIASMPMKEQQAPLKVTHDETGIFMNTMLLVINPYSQHQEAALRYLEYMSSKRTAEDYMLFSSMTEPLLDVGMDTTYQATLLKLEAEQAKVISEDEMLAHQDRLEELEAEVDMLEQFRFRVSREAIAQYHSLSERFVVPTETEVTFSDKMDTLIDRVVDGNMALKMFAIQADTYIEMIEKEK